MKMKTKLLITTLSLIATSAYAQPSIPSVGMPPPTVRAEMPREAAPSMPQPAVQRPEPQFIGGPQPSVSAPPPREFREQKLPTPTDVSTPTPSVYMYNGVGPLPANDAKAPTSVGASSSKKDAVDLIQVEDALRVRSEFGAGIGQK